MRTTALDKIDLNLIRLLQGNARLSVTELAHEMRLARTTVHERLKRMEHNGTIQGYTIRLNRDPYSEYTRFYVIIEAQKNKQSSIIESIGRFHEITLAQIVNGDANIICSGLVPRLEDLEALTQELATIVGIVRMEILIVLTDKLDRRMSVGIDQAIYGAAAISRGEA